MKMRTTQPPRLGSGRPLAPFALGRDTRGGPLAIEVYRPESHQGRLLDMLGRARARPSDFHYAFPGELHPASDAFHLAQRVESHRELSDAVVVRVPRARASASTTVDISPAARATWHVVGWADLSPTTQRAADIGIMFAVEHPSAGMAALHGIDLLARNGTLLRRIFAEIDRPGPAHPLAPVLADAGFDVVFSSPSMGARFGKSLTAATYRPWPLDAYGS